MAQPKPRGVKMCAVGRTCGARRAPQAARGGGWSVRLTADQTSWPHVSLRKTARTPSHCVAWAVEPIAGAGGRCTGRSAAHPEASSRAALSVGLRRGRSLDATQEARVLALGMVGVAVKNNYNFFQFTYFIFI